jgi:hypothetical protein
VQTPEVDVVTVLSRSSNSWVVRLPNRQYPGVVVQGDSLKILCDLADDVVRLTEEGTEARELAEELHDDLHGRLAVYEAAMRANGLELPYSKPPT